MCIAGMRRGAPRPLSQAEETKSGGEGCWTETDPWVGRVALRRQEARGLEQSLKEAGRRGAILIIQLAVFVKNKGTIMVSFQLYQEHPFRAVLSNFGIAPFGKVNLLG